MTKRILYCEDDDYLRELVTSQLKSSYNNPFIVQALNGFEGFEQFQLMSFDFIISDYDMKVPKGDGGTLYEKVRTINKKITFIMFTSMNKELFSCFQRDPNFYYINKNILMDGKKITDILSEFNLT